MRAPAKRLLRVIGVEGSNPSPSASWKKRGFNAKTQLDELEEAIAKGDKAAPAKIPYWRALKADGFLNEKYPGGQEAHKERLENEGVEVIARGKKYQVVNSEKYLMKL